MTDRLSIDELTSDQLDALQDERAELLAELQGRDAEARERWIQKQLDETGIRAMDFRNGASMELEPARELVAHWVGAARAMLGDAPNYSETPIEMEVKVGGDSERFAFILQRVGKLTPHQVRQQAEARAEAAEAAIARVRSLAERWESALAVDLPYARDLRAALDEPKEQRPAKPCCGRDIGHVPTCRVNQGLVDKDGEPLCTCTYGERCPNCHD